MEALLFEEEDVTALVQAFDALGLWQVPAGELSIALVDDEEIARVHDVYLGDDSPTDVITFPGEEEEFAGEIVVSAETARRAAREEDTTLAYEISLYLVHGLLHLSGLGDASEEERARMRRAEAVALKKLEKQGALPAFHWRD